MTQVSIAKVSDHLDLSGLLIFFCLCIMDIDIELSKHGITGYYIYDRFHLGMYFSTADKQTFHVLLKLHTSE